jgi:hypothetical protein
VFPLLFKQKYFEIKYDKKKCSSDTHLSDQVLFNRKAHKEGAKCTKLKHYNSLRTLRKSLRTLRLMDFFFGIFVIIIKIADCGIRIAE